MNAAAGTTSSSARSNGTPTLAAAAGTCGVLSIAVVIAPSPSVRRIDERALDRNVDANDVAERGVDRSAHMQHRARRRDHVEQRIASAVLDVVDLGADRIEAAGTFSDMDILGADRDHRALA